MHLSLALVTIALTAVSVVANGVALAFPPRSPASLAIGFGAAILSLVAAAVVGPFLALLPAATVAILVAREWSYRWCLLTLPGVALAYALFEVVLPARWPFLLLTLAAYAIPVVVEVRRRSESEPSV